MLTFADSYYFSLQNKYKQVIENRWIWVIIAFVVLAGIFAYAFYCTSRGYNFGGFVRYKWPRTFEIGIPCTR